MKEIVEENIRKMEEVLKNLKILDKNALELYNLAVSYFLDSKYFLEKNDLIRAFECITISWAYIDALLHLKLVEIDEKYKRYFTKYFTI
jgi:hypothetical protein